LPVPHLSEEHAERAAAMAETVRRAATGDEIALESLLVDAQEVAWRFSMAVCGHAEDAEDAMQEALVRTYRHIPQIREPEAFRPWLYRTVRNACLMSRRKRVAEPKRLLSIDELLPSANSAGTKIDPPSTLPTPEDTTARTRLRRRLKRALQTLPPPFRAVVFLRDMEGLSTRETATTLGISEDNVKARLHRARLTLRRELSALDKPAAARVRVRREPS
jgi:RNA polymerase sigma-70 factor (ECF subfamily)